MTPEQIIFQKLADGKTITDLGKHKVMIGTSKIHYRFKSFPKANPDKFPFNINPNSVDAEFELFICGSEHKYYLIPIDILKMMYSHPNAYPDRHHPNIRVITIDSFRDKVTYAKPSISLDLTPYKNKSLKDNTKTKIVLPTQNEVTTKKYGDGGEGKEHLDFKNLIADNPSLIGIENVTKVENDNHIFPSADRPDIIFTCSDNKYFIVEIEIENCIPGAYQAIKYKSLFCAEKGLALNADNVTTMLVARKINQDVKQFCDKYGVKTIERTK